MILNDEIIVDYLKEPSSNKYRNHWIFYNIEPNKYMYDTPSRENVEVVKEIYIKIKIILMNFKPINEDIFKVLFPNYKNVFESTKVLLVVGCPKMYDAMFIEHEDEEYIIFDLINLVNYIKHGHDIEKVLKNLLTHEFVHRCVKEKYPLKENLPYVEKLNYIVFNEGFAHLLAYKDNIKEYDFNSKFYLDKYENAKLKLRNAIKEKNETKQEKWLKEADVGNYWNKFGAISGKLYLAQHIDLLIEIYTNGWRNIIFNIIRE
ncbi:hypothetical protein [Clostridium ihumii]|uniref:hypothetical protein n=1 Tax=Clostridium ihumii TaxID=1470356 RepID=UPI003D32631C